MIKKHLFPLFLSVSILFISCKKELEPQDSSGIQPQTTAETAVPAPPTPAVAPPTIAAPPTTVAPQPQMQTVTAPPAKVLPGMNPPHGQAGHRCDIAVGAPLNSPPNKAVTPGKPTTVTPMQNNAVAVPTTPSAPAILTPNAAATATPPGMNPPHGQEGHLCSVAVGAPLPKT